MERLSSHAITPISTKGDIYLSRFFFWYVNPNLSRRFLDDKFCFVNVDSNSVSNPVGNPACDAVKSMWYREFIDSIALAASSSLTQLGNPVLADDIAAWVYYEFVSHEVFMARNGYNEICPVWVGLNISVGRPVLL